MEGGTKEDLKILDIDPKELEMEALMKSEENVRKIDDEVKSGEPSAPGMSVSLYSNLSSTYIASQS